MKKPITFEAYIPLRFSDFDPYGHVSAKNYLDYVLSSRMMFLNERFGINDQFFTSRKVGFYLTRSDISYRRAIEGMQLIHCKSHIDEMTAARVQVVFEIRSQDKTVLHANGRCEFAIIDLTTNRPTGVPEWALPFFFEEGDDDQPGQDVSIGEIIDRR